METTASLSVTVLPERRLIQITQAMNLIGMQVVMDLVIVFPYQDCVLLKLINYER